MIWMTRVCLAGPHTYFRARSLGKLTDYLYLILLWGELSAPAERIFGQSQKFTTATKSEMREKI